MAKQKSTTKRKVENYRHNEERLNNPPVGLVTPQSDVSEKTAKYQHDPHIDPTLSWAGKAERTAFEIPTVSLHVHEKIDPKVIIQAVKSGNGNGQMPLFESPSENPSLRHAVEFYRHAHDWSNRLIAGDSLLVMNSLLEKEGMAGKVQCVYMDPPYGIKYGSNFQPFVKKRDVKDGKDEDLTAEPEMLKAFRDTWELGVHSYLTYMRDRLLLAQEMLTDSGSCFVQIGDENVHLVRNLMDDIFGANNCITTISFATTSGSSTAHLPQVADYLLWYAKDKNKIKYRQLYEPLSRAEIIDYFNWDVMVELKNGRCRKLTEEERFAPDKYLPKGARIYGRTGLDSQGVSTTGRSEPYEWNGKKFHCSRNRQWSISKEGMDKLGKLGRLEALEGQNSLRWKKYENETPGRRINNIWSAQMYPSDKNYVVETSVKVIQRCMLMTTDPGDLVFDPTCGSGTTAYVAEQWGRRWITCDTSRVALILARQRLMTAVYYYYQLATPPKGVGEGFVYKNVPKVSPNILAGNEPPQTETLYDQPLKDDKRARVAGPFTVEAVPSPIVKSVEELAHAAKTPVADTAVPPGNEIARSGETLRHNEWREELLKTGVIAKAKKRLRFARVDTFPAHWLHAEAETVEKEPKRVFVSFGPEHAMLEQRQVALALEEAEQQRPKPDMVVFAAFEFDPEAAKDIDETNWAGGQMLKVKMNTDMQTADLKKARAGNESFWLMGQPDVRMKKIERGEFADHWQVTVHGFDYYDPRNGELESGGADQIAVWMLDTDYDGRALYPRQVFFPLAGEKDGWHKLAKNLKAEIDPDKIIAYFGVESLPFKMAGFRRIAVKIVDDRGVESMKVLNCK